jgi:hypothetical protein
MTDGPAYWRVFNALARVVATLFTIAGVLFLLTGLAFSSGSDRVIELWVSGFLIVVGILMLRVKPFRPDLDGLESAFREPSTKERSWWTGDPKS